MKVNKLIEAHRLGREQGIEIMRALVGAVVTYNPTMCGEAFVQELEKELEAWLEMDRRMTVMHRRK